LTGRENIRLNGTILGMRLSEIRRRTDAIVAFSGVERFLDMPVKHYSSGMRMRLAFSVAAHLDRDVFFLDEVLAVGDMDFQERCLARIRSLAQQGRTIVLVNHGADVVQSLCSRALLLDGGRLVADGPPEETLAAYGKLREPNKGGNR
jgi:lipopolysaccharide transport system ATP-binding protein